MTHGIRPSQFVTMYGPGTILETTNGPVVIPTADVGLFHKQSEHSPENYSVDTVVARMMSKIASKGRPGPSIGIFRIPANTELGLRSEVVVYRTVPFSKWRLCLRQDDHANKLAGNPVADKTDVLHEGDRCPVCTHVSGGKNAIRFVSVCNSGHLDDVDWNFAVHGGPCAKNRKRQHFLWHRTGGTLKDITIACPHCGKLENFGKCFNREQNCSGRSPENEPVGAGPRRRSNSCSAKKSRIMQRQAANIRIPEVETYLAIHPVRTDLDKMVRTSGIGIAATMAADRPGGLDDDGNFEEFVSAMRKTGVPDSTVAAFKRAKRDELKRVVDCMNDPLPETHTDMLSREYGVLVRASREGAPPESGAGDGPPSFEVCREDVRAVTAKNGRKFTVVPVRTLEAVAVQSGFRRIVPSWTQDGGSDPAKDNQSEVVDIGFIEGDKKWYPGTLLRGEGLFITLDGQDLALADRASEAWRRGVSSDYADHLFRDQGAYRDELEPEFVWWHTISHMLIRSIGELAGYSAASIRERVYYGRGMKPGGILLYATQPGAGGTLGGLVGLAPRLGQFIDRTQGQAYTCSADPVCEQDRFSPGRVTGSCCYGCLLNPETSCEHRNMWLDRTVVGNNPP